MIVSFYPGRVRLRFKELKNKAAAEKARARIAEEPGISKVEVNTLTGSILIEYDTNILPLEQFMETGRRELAKLNIPVE
ncbi:HMA2 domain-containing protein [Breznakiellaceae bacterium SP9]